MRKRLTANGPASGDDRGLGDPCQQTRPIFADFELDHVGGLLRLTHTDERTAGILDDGLVFPLRPDARRIDLVILDRLGAGNNDRAFARLGQSAACIPADLGVFAIFAPTVIGQ